MGEGIISRRGGGGYITINFNLPAPPPTKSEDASLSQARTELAATSVGNYALFGGGGDGSVSNYYDTVDAYDTNLTRTTRTALSQARRLLAATSVGNYALFGGGDDGSGPSYSPVDAYDTNLSRTTTTELSQARDALAATSLGNYALFGGGQQFDISSTYSTVDAYDTNLSRTTPTALSQDRTFLSATNVGNYALFGGGRIGSTSFYNKVDVYTSPSYNVQLFPETKYSFNGAAESTSSTWQTINVTGSLIGYMKIKSAQIN